MRLVVTGLVAGLSFASGVEPPCAETAGEACEWVTESSSDGSWDSFCWRCYRYRDWDLREREGPE